MPRELSGPHKRMKSGLEEERGGGGSLDRQIRKRRPIRGPIAWSLKMQKTENQPHYFYLLPGVPFAPLPFWFSFSSSSFDTISKNAAAVIFDRRGPRKLDGKMHMTFIPLHVPSRPVIWCPTIWQRVSTNLKIRFTGENKRHYLY